MNREAPKGLLITTILIGAIFLFGPIIYKIINDVNHKNYIETTATFIKTVTSHTNDNGQNMYSLYYEYSVNGQQYFYITDYSTSVIPDNGSTITIKYNPSDPWDVQYGFNAYKIFQIIGGFFLCVSLIILFWYWIWFRDIMFFLGTSSLMIVFIINKFYTGGFIFALIFLGIMCFASVMDFISYYKSHKFSPLEDIKKDIAISKEIRKIKKEEKNNLSPEQIKIKNKKIKKIIIGLLLFVIPLPLYVFIDVNFGFPNLIIFCIFLFMAIIGPLAGFFILGTILMGFDFDNTITAIAGKKINNEDIKNRKKMTLYEKIKAFNIIGLLLKIISVPLFLGLIWLVIEDPINFFDNFENVARAQLFTIIELVIVANILFFKVNKIKISKLKKVVLIIGYIFTSVYGYFITIPEDNDKSILSSVQFQNIMSNYGYSVSQVYEIEGLEISDSTIYLAKNDNIMIYYIISANNKSTTKIFDSINDADFKQCLLGGMGGRSGNQKESQCKDPSYFKIAYKIKNTMIYAESSLESKDKIENILKTINYSK